MPLKCAIHLALCRIPSSFSMCACTCVFYFSLSSAAMRPTYLPSLRPSSLPRVPFPLLITFITSIGCPHISFIFPHAQRSLAKEEPRSLGRDRTQETERASEQPSLLPPSSRIIDVCIAAAPAGQECLDVCKSF